MIRTQVQIDEATYDALRNRAFEEHRSMSSIIRDLLSQSLGHGRNRRKKPAVRFTFVGMVRGDKKDVSERHDDYLGGGKRW